MKTDILIIGAGIAGLTYALEAPKLGKVILCTKDKLGESNTRYAQGGIAGVIDPSDSYKSHIKDTLNAGRGLCNLEAVKILSKESTGCIKKLISLGVKFDSNKSKIELGKEGGHSERRVAHVKDKTGSAIEKALVSKVKSKVKVLENSFVFKLIVKDKRCLGARIIYKGDILDIFSKVTVLAAGGACQVYSKTTNPEGATGDGLALAYEAGAKLQDLEFIQFHPTALDLDGSPVFLISEAVRGEGGILKNAESEVFMHRYHQMADLAPRDIVAKAILSEIEKTGQVFLDVTHLPSSLVKKRFPAIYKTCLESGLDITKEPIPIAPAAHYICGGVKTDTLGETSIKGLFAIGEAACTGVHGANRLASNSLLEGVVFGLRAVKKAEKYLKKGLAEVKLPRIRFTDVSIPKNLKSEVQEIMWDKVGLVRTKSSLNSALKELKILQQKIDKYKAINREFLELRNLITCSLLIANSALQRTESRGVHYRLDFPEASKEWKGKHIVAGGGR